MFIFFFGYMYNSVYDQTSKLLVTKLFWRRPPSPDLLHVVQTIWEKTPFSRFVTCSRNYLEKTPFSHLLHVVETNLDEDPIGAQKRIPTRRTSRTFRCLLPVHVPRSIRLSRRFGP